VTAPADLDLLPAEVAGVDLWGAVVGQASAVAQLRAAARAPVHAYLLVGPRGSGKRALARAFAAALLSSGRAGDDAVRHAQLALAEAHPDLTVVERRGASIQAEQADEVIGAAARASVEGGGKVIVLDEFHLVTPQVGNKLLKSIEEPPAGTVFVVLADDVTPDLVTIASRCVRVDLGAVPVEALVDALVDRLRRQRLPRATRRPSICPEQGEAWALQVLPGGRLGPPPPDGSGGPPGVGVTQTGPGPEHGAQRASASSGSGTTVCIR